jgi:hypothetical protein
MLYMFITCSLIHNKREFNRMITFGVDFLSADGNVVGDDHTEMSTVQ